MDAGRELESRSATVHALLAALVLLFSTALHAQAPVVTGDAYGVNAHGLLTVPATSGVLANDTGFNPATHRLESHDPVSQYGAVIALAGWPVRAISARNCRPAIRPSPVVA